MNRAEALVLAREHVEKMSTNHRGYQDGVNLAGKVAAVETFARFLMEDADKVEVRATTGPLYELTPERWASLVYLANFQLQHGPTDRDDEAQALLDDLEAL